MVRHFPGLAFSAPPNDLLSDVTSSPSLFTFNHHFKMQLFRLSYTLISPFNCSFVSYRHFVVLVEAVCCLGHVKNYD